MPYKKKNPYDGYNPNAKPTRVSKLFLDKKK